MVCYEPGSPLYSARFFKQNKHLACSKGAIQDERPPILFRTFAVYITLGASMEHPVPFAMDEAFQAVLQGEDELGVVIRAHIHLEANLLELLEHLLVSPKHAEKMSLDYAQRVHLAVALGLHSQYESPLLALGTLRNAFAHRPGTKLTKDRIDNLYSCLSSDMKQIVQNAHQNARKKRPEVKVAPFGKLKPRDQFILIAIALRALLQVAIRDAKASQ